MTSTEADYETNEFGDRIIVTKVHLNVGEVLKGPKTQELTLDLEGGTVGEITLKVSDLPSLAPGERAVFFVAHDRHGRLVPHLRGQSVLALDADDRVHGSPLTLRDVRAEVQAAR